MIRAPAWRWTPRIVATPWTAAPLAVPCALLVPPRLGDVLTSFGAAAGVAALLGASWGATVAWLHLLAFDPFAGRWLFLDGRARGARWRWRRCSR